MTKLVCFDLDDTLIREIHSVMFLCMMNGKLDELMQIEKQESIGALHWIDADYQKAQLIKGLKKEGLQEAFIKTMKPLNNIKKTVAALSDNGMQSIVITAGPRQVAAVVKKLWGFHSSYGSDYETVGGVFTGKILQHVGDQGKISCLLQHCTLHQFLPEECVVVGDGATDIPLFEFCQKSIAINASVETSQKATYSINTNDLSDILQFF